MGRRGIRAVAKVTALHLGSHGCQRLKGPEPLKTPPGQLLCAACGGGAEGNRRPPSEGASGQPEASLRFPDSEANRAVTL